LIQISCILDRESTDHYNLEIIAQDGGVPSRTSTTSLMITIMDINDIGEKLLSLSRLFADDTSLGYSSQNVVTDN
jgi:hypothetical protein